MMTDTPADLAARCDELEAVVGRMTPGEWRRKKAYGTHVESAVDGGYQDSPTVVTTWSSSFAPPLDESVRNATGIVALRNTALPLIRQLRERLAAVEGAVSDWHCKACNTVFPDWGDKMRCSCGKGERWPSSFNQRRAERDCEAAIKNANECLIAVRDSYLSMNEAKADAGKLRDENGRLREANVRLERLVHIMGDKMGWMVSVVSGEGKRWEEDGNKAVALSFALVTETIVKGHGYEPDGECMAEFDELIAALGITLATGGEGV